VFDPPRPSTLDKSAYVYSCVNVHIGDAVVLRVLDAGRPSTWPWD